MFSPQEIFRISDLLYPFRIYSDVFTDSWSQNNFDVSPALYSTTAHHPFLLFHNGQYPQNHSSTLHRSFPEPLTKQIPHLSSLQLYCCWSLHGSLNQFFHIFVNQQLPKSVVWYCHMFSLFDIIVLYFSIFWKSYTIFHSISSNFNYHTIQCHFIQHNHKWKLWIYIKKVDT